MSTTSMLALEIVWFDDDMLELKLRASSEKFSGEVNFYSAPDEPSNFANQIAGFPLASSDVREYEFGGTNLPGYGGAKLRFSCVDITGHLAIQAELYMMPVAKTAAKEAATIQIATVAAAIDEFVSALRRMRTEVGQMAVLYHAP